MHKIMFVEDQISENVDRLLILFDSILSEEEKKLLDEASVSDMGVNGEDIRDILKDNTILDVIDSFEEALKRITECDLNQYDFFIFDRNLTEGRSYEPQKIRQQDDTFDDIIFYQKEGDFLTQKLFIRGCDIRHKVFFCSAYGQTKYATTLDQMIDFGTFFKGNFFEKADDESLRRLRRIIDDNDCLLIITKYREAFSGLHKINCSEKENELLEILNDKISINSDKPRVILDAIMQKIEINHRQFFVQNANISKNSYLSDCINSLATTAKLTDKTTSKVIGTPSVPNFIHTHCTTINKICSSYFAHTSKENNFNLPPPTKESGLSVRYALLEILIWLDKVL